MTPTTTNARWRSAWFIALLSAFLAAGMLLFSAGTAHAAAAPDTPGADQEQTPFYFAGAITLDGEPIPDVKLSVTGNGFDAETVTNADGAWRLYVPEKEKYTISVDESTLPDGVIVDAEQLPDGATAVQGVTGSFEAEFGLTGTKIINLFLGEGERITTSFFDQLVERLINGLNFGLLLALAAIGVSLIFGTTGLTNFAHAEMVTFGAIVAMIFGTFLAVPMYLTIPIVLLSGALLGAGMDAALWRPLRKRAIGMVPLMIVSIGLSLLGRYTFQFFFGGSTTQLPGADSPKITLLGPIKLSVIDMMSMGISIVVILGVAYFLLRTRIGKATRAISDNPGLAAASGINVDRVIRIVWIISTSLAALAGVLWGYFRPGVKWDMGVQVLLLMFAAVTLGGLGTAFGALVGAIIIGILVEVSSLWIPADLKYVGALVVLIAILMIRPQGILGRRERIG